MPPADDGSIGGTFVSPVVEFVLIGGGDGEEGGGGDDSAFIIDLPVNEETKARAVRQITAQNGCLAAVPSCEWLDPSTGVWSNSGCVLASQGRGFAKCECSHLTVR